MRQGKGKSEELRDATMAIEWIGAEHTLIHYTKHILPSPYLNF